jgi:glutamine amidotransferase
MIAIIKYNAGNIKSVQNAVNRLGFDGVVTDDVNQIMQADKVIFPGVGEASSAMKYLKEKGLDKVIVSLKVPVLGICLGQQLLCKYSEEGNTTCLGVFDAAVRAFPPSDIVPHMGWNNLSVTRTALLDGVNEVDDVYFIHGYYVAQSAETIASCDYILTFSAAMQKDNFYATQFHPEKSGAVGEVILKNFLSMGDIRHKT